MSNDWYRTFFTDQYLRSRQERVGPERTLQEVEFVVATLGLREGSKVLDLCCGQGRHAVELARRGMEVTGLDLSEYLLERARQAAAEAEVPVRFVHCDARENPFHGEFDAVLNMFTAFGYLETDAEDQKVLDGVARALKPGGKFLLDFINRERIIRRLSTNDWQTLEDGTLSLNERRFDLQAGKIHATETTIFPDGRREQASHAVRFYTCPELRRMLEQAGLTATATYGDFDGSEYGLDTRRLIVVSERAA